MTEPVKTRENLKILLLQIRDEANVRLEEHASFARYAGLQMPQIDILNVFDEPDFSVDRIKGYDALFVGGASEASVLEADKYSFLRSSQNLLLACIEQNIPVFASCFGFQLAVIALGGEIIRDQTDFEMGVIRITLTAEAAEDPLFNATAESFLAVAVHKERALQAPANCTMLAFTDQCCHAFRINDKPFWAFQFHPEVDKATLVERLTIFKAQYTENEAHLNQVLQNAQETPESNDLLKQFVDKILIPK